MKKKTHIEIVRDILNRGEMISTVDAVKMRMLRLGARINDLRNQGMNIETIRLTDKKGRKLAYVGYKLK